MKREEITQNNKLIAEFVGFKYTETFAGMRWIYKDEYPCYATSLLAFHESWDWLMPVVEKIQKETVGNVTIRVGICTIIRKFIPAKVYAKEQGIEFTDVSPIAECNSSDFIGNVYEAVVGFIQWHNQQNKAPR